MSEFPDHREKTLYERSVQIIEAARAHVSRTVNTSMVHAYWLIGREIVEVEQSGKERAAYGEQLIHRLADRLSKRFGKGFSPRTVRRIRQFYLAYPTGSNIAVTAEGPSNRSALLSESDAEGIRSALLTRSAPTLVPIFPPALGWSHYLVLMRVENPEARVGGRKILRHREPHPSPNPPVTRG